jgi:hypothetical protein
MGFTGVIVGVTGNAHESDVAEFMRAGTNRVMVKPLDADEFWTTVVELLSAGIAAPQVTPPKEEASKGASLSLVGKFFVSPESVSSSGGKQQQLAKSESGSGSKKESKYALISSPNENAIANIAAMLAPVTPPRRQLDSSSLKGLLVGQLLSPVSPAAATDSGGCHGSTKDVKSPQSVSGRMSADVLRVKSTDSSPNQL